MHLRAQSTKQVRRKPSCLQHHWKRGEGEREGEKEREGGESEGGRAREGGGVREGEGG